MNHYHRIANAGEVGARPKKEMGHAEAQPQEKTTYANSTAPAPERGIYNPLTWRSEKSVKFRVGWLVLLAVVLIVGWMR